MTHLNVAIPDLARAMRVKLQTPFHHRDTEAQRISVLRKTVFERARHSVVPLRYRIRHGGAPLIPSFGMSGRRPLSNLLERTCSWGTQRTGAQGYRDVGRYWVPRPGHLSGRAEPPWSDSILSACRATRIRSPTLPIPTAAVCPAPAPAAHTPGWLLHRRRRTL